MNAAARRKQKSNREDITVFVTIGILVLVFGVLSMGFQLVASRLLAPYYGSSILVWAWLISVFLLAFSVGSIFGGIITGFSNSRRRAMITLLMIACVTGFAINVFFARPLLDLLETLFQSDTAGIVLSCFTLFFAPIAALSGLIPECVAVCGRHGLTAGLAAGVIYGISTIGNIAGVIITAFCLVPRFPVSVILHAWLALSCLSVASLWFVVRST